MKTRVTPLPVVLTIGHSTRTLGSFIRILRAHGITRLVDVRKMPRSRHNPQFNDDSLPDNLLDAGIGYVHIAGLGGLRRTRADSPNQGWRNLSFRAYADYMQTSEFRKNLQTLIDLGRHERVAIMCAEAVPWRCHRSLIADALLVHGLHVIDVVGENRCQDHSLPAWAHVDGTTITYPADETAGVSGGSRTTANGLVEDQQESRPMKHNFKVGDHVSWNSEAGRVRGTIKKKITSEISFKGYKVHASKEEPQYLIASDKTDHQAMHKGSALKKIGKSTASPKRSTRAKTSRSKPGS